LRRRGAPERITERPKCRTGFANAIDQVEQLLRRPAKAVGLVTVTTSPGFNAFTILLN